MAAPGKTSSYTYDGAGNRDTLTETYTSDQASGYVDEASGSTIMYRSMVSNYYNYSGTNALLGMYEAMKDSTGSTVLTRSTLCKYDYNGNKLAEEVSYNMPAGTQTETFSLFTYNDTTTTFNSRINRTENTYDGFNRLVKIDSIKDGNRVISEYGYDGDDQRVSKITKRSQDSYVPVETHYLYDGQNVILETNETGAMKARYIRGVNYIARVDALASLSYFLFNGHGDVVQTATAAGVVQNQYDYDIFGSPALTVESYECSIRYSGYLYDAETGLYYLNARYYDSRVGRFLTEDSYKGSYDDPLSLNLYTYCYNDPIQLYDPTGHWGGRPGENLDDASLDSDQEAAIAQLTNDYYETNDPAVRESIHNRADQIRSGDLDPSVVIGSSTTDSAVKNNVQSILDNPYAAESAKANLRSADISIFTVSSTNTYERREINAEKEYVLEQINYGLSGFDNQISWATFDQLGLEFDYSTMTMDEWNSFWESEQDSLRRNWEAIKELYYDIQNGDIDKISKQYLDSLLTSLDAFPGSSSVKKVAMVAKEAPDTITTILAAVSRFAGRNADDALQGTVKAGKIVGSTTGLEAHEVKIIDDLVGKGNTVEVVPRSNVQGVKTYDLKVNGVPTEMKTLQSPNTGTGAKRIYEGLQQGADTVILDGRQAGLTTQQAQEVLSRAAGKYANKQIPGNVQIWTNDGIITYP